MLKHSYFAEDHSGPEQQLPGPAHIPVTRSSVPADCSEEELRALAKELDFHLRYDESIPVYDLLIEAHPDDAELARTRAARCLTTLRCEEAAAGFRRSLELGAEPAAVLYRLGLAAYFSGDYAGAMAYEEQALPYANDELSIAMIYWHTLAALKSGAEPVLLAGYRPGMDVGHHISYDRAMALISGNIDELSYRKIMDDEDSDLEYPMLAYALSVLLGTKGKKKESRALLEDIVKRDSFWIAYGYVAAWNELYAGERG